MKKNAFVNGTKRKGCFVSGQGNPEVDSLNLVDVCHVCYTDMIHGFLSFSGGITAGMELIEEISQRLANL